MATSRLPVGSSASSNAAGWPARGRSRRAAARRPTACRADARARCAKPEVRQQRRRPRSRLSRATAGDHLRQHDVLQRREFGAAGGGTGRRSRCGRGGCAVRSASASRAGVAPVDHAPRRRRGRSSRPARCSSVDLPAPEGATSATISPGRSVRSTPRRTCSVRRRRCDSVRAGPPRQQPDGGRHSWRSASTGSVRAARQDG